MSTNMSIHRVKSAKFSRKRTVLIDGSVEKHLSISKTLTIVDSKGNTTTLTLFYEE